jgi:hypothetical protein
VVQREQHALWFSVIPELKGVFYAKAEREPMKKELAKTYDPKGIEDKSKFQKETVHYCHPAPEYHGPVAHGPRA